MLRKLIVTTAQGLLIALLLCVLVELGVRASGAATPTPGEILDRNAAYLLPHPESPGVWTTNYWEDVREELVLRPRRKRTKVVLFGGSNAWAFRESMLRNALNGACPERQFQVVNLGRNGFGSERVRLIFEQALECLAPDVAVLYLGDNEFIESPYPRAVRELPHELRGLHSARLIAMLVGQLRAGAYVQPEPWVPDWDHYMGFTYDRTLEQLEVLRENLRAMVELAERKDVRVVVCTVAYNRFSAPHGTRLGPELQDAARERFEGLRARAVALLPRFLDPLLPVDQDDRVRRLDWDLGTGDEPEARGDGQRVGMRPCTGPLADLELGLPAHEGWHARVWRLNETLARLHARDLSGGERDALGEAAQRLDAALALVPDHPRSLFERALVAYLLSEDAARVEQLFLDAGRFDRAPKKSNEAINQVLRELAAEHPNTLLFDADERFAAWSPDRLVGWEILYDHCHLLPGPNKLVMDMLGEEIVERWFASE